MSAPEPADAFSLERHGDVMVIVASPALERMDIDLAGPAAEVILGPIRALDDPQVVFDLSRVDYFGSIFLALVLRCWKLAEVRGGTVALAGVSERARELLRVTSLDHVWPIYATTREAIEALSVD